MNRLTLNAFTVDVEDYFHVSAFADRVSMRDWERMELRADRSTRRLLSLLDRHEVKGTFFFLGWLAERCPDLVREVADRGHELGWHTFSHRLVYHMTPEEFRADLRKGRELLEPLSGQKLRAFRAPSFSITARSTWALEILQQEGFTLDSSIFPIYHDRYGMPHVDPKPHEWELPSGRLTEFPMSVHRVLGMNVPASGGGYFRIYPRPLSTWLLRKVNAAGNPFVFYVHPWEIDPLQPRLEGRWRSRLRHYANLKNSERKLDELLGQFRFGTLSDALAAYEESHPRTSWSVMRLDAAHPPTPPRAVEAASPQATMTV